MSTRSCTRNGEETELARRAPGITTRTSKGDETELARRAPGISTRSCTSNGEETELARGEGGGGGVDRLFKFFAWEPLVRAPLLTEIESIAMLAFVTCPT